MDYQLRPRSCNFLLLRTLAILRPLQILSPFCAPLIFIVSVKFVSAILGPEMAATISWTPGKNAFFLQEKPCP